MTRPAFSGAERSKRYRERQAEKEIVVGLPIKRKFVADLVEDGLLDEKLADDRAEIARVVDENFKLVRKSENKP